MINLKLFGLPRTGTNAIAYNVEQTWPGLVKVWHEETPSGEAVWQHGLPKVCDGIDGYLLTTKPLTPWLASMKRYGQCKTVEDLVRVWGTQNSEGIYRRWQSAVREFGGKSVIIDVTQEQSDMLDVLHLIEIFVDFPPVLNYHVEMHYMRRGADNGKKLSEELYRWPK